MQQPPSGFIEYPKWVTPPGGVPRVVQTAEQEAAAMAAPAPAAPPAPPPDDREALRQRARDLGVAVDGRWSADRLRTEIETVSPGPTSPQPEETPP